MKKMLLVTFLAVSFMLLVKPIGYANNPLPPPPEGSEYGSFVGPDITGTLTFVRTLVSGSYWVYITLDGSCKNISLNNTIRIASDFFGCVSPEWLLGTCEPSCSCNGMPQYFPETLVPLDCYPDKNVGYPVVYKVMHFNESGSTKTADIVGRFPVIKLIKK